MASNKRIAKAITAAKKSGEMVRLNVRLMKNGKFSSITGKVEAIKVNEAGFPYAVVKPKGNKHVQSVPFDYVRQVVINDEVVAR